MIARSSLETKTYRSFSSLFCRLERNRKFSIEKRKLNMWFVNEHIIRQCAYRGAMITSANPTWPYQCHRQIIGQWRWRNSSLR